MNEFFSSLISAELGLIGVAVPTDRICDRPSANPNGAESRIASEAPQPASRIVFQDSDLRSALG